MTVYVDAAIHAWKGKKWCHLFSADLDELHSFALRLGMQRSWFQEPPVASWPHYDVPQNRRSQAVRSGAVEADRLTFVRVSSEAMLTWCLLHRPDMVERATAKRDRWAAHGRTVQRSGDLFP